ncbi:MAG: hypothetical protein HY058_11030 [Proteobacteria bacterium]|nr:hypothetical protein [Pseudomonadota bacterium]
MTTIEPSGSHGDIKMWPSEAWAIWIYDVANIALIISLATVAVVTVLVVWMGNVKEDFLKRDLASAQLDASHAVLQTAILNKEAELARAAIAQAELHAAEANEKAESERLARLKLEIKLAPRSLGPARTDQLASQLTALAGIGIDLVVYEGLSPDAAPLSHEIANALKAAGATVRILTPFGAGAVFGGILVRCETDASPNIQAAVSTLVTAFHTVGLDAVPWEPYPIGEQPSNSYNGPGGENSKLRVLIGAKP